MSLMSGTLRGEYGRQLGLSNRAGGRSTIYREGMTLPALSLINSELFY